MRALDRGHSQRALARLPLAERLSCNSGRVTRLKGVVLLPGGDLSTAEAVLAAAVEHIETPLEKGRRLVNQGWALIEQGCYEPAMQILDQARRAPPMVTPASAAIAEARLRQGSAGEDVLELLDFEPKEAEPLEIPVLSYGSADRIWALSRLGRHTDAEAALEQLSSELAGPCLPRAAGLHYRLGRAFLEANRADAVAKHFGQSCGLDPNGRAGRQAAEALRQLNGGFWV